MPPLAPAGGFRRFWLAFAVSDIGSAVTQTVLPILVVLHLGGGPVDVAVVLIAAQVPSALFQLPIGVIADRLPRSGRILAAVDLSSALLVGGMMLASTGAQLQLAILAVLVFAKACVAALRAPLASAVLNLVVVDDESKVKANGLLGATNAAGDIVGGLCGAAVLTWTGPVWALGVDFASYTAAAIIDASIRVPQVSEPSDDENENGRSFTRALSAIGAVMKGRLFLATCVAALVVGAVQAVLMTFLLDDGDFTAGRVALALSIGAIGGVAGGLAVATDPSARWLPQLALVLMSAAMILLHFSQSGSWWMLLAYEFVGSFGGSALYGLLFGRI